MKKNSGFLGRNPTEQKIMGLYIHGLERKKKPPKQEYYIQQNYPLQVREK